MFWSSYPTEQDDWWHSHTSVCVYMSMLRKIELINLAKVCQISHGMNRW